VVKPHLVRASSLVSLSEISSQYKLTVLSDALSKSSDVIELVSENGKLVVPVHKELLCFFSSYYSAALNGNFSEAQKNRFEVALSVERLKWFKDWLYTGEIPTDQKHPLRYMQLYIFADLVDIIALRRDVMGLLIQVTTFLAEYDEVRYVLENVTPHSQLYKWVRDCYSGHWNQESDEEDPCLFNNDTDPDHLLAAFMYEVMKGLAIRGSAQRDQSYEGYEDWITCSCCNNPCEYHEHSCIEEWEASMLTLSI